MQGRPVGYNLSNWTCNWNNGYRLPTEAEWEKAARGGAAGQRFPWSDTDTIQHARANYYSSSTLFYDTSPTRGFHPDFAAGGIPHTSPVQYFAANSYGLYDVAGNISEWCNDWFGAYGASPQTNPHGPTNGTYRVYRGGSSGSYATECRVSGRASSVPNVLSAAIGFRVVVPYGAFPVPGDFNGDCDVDTDDFTTLASCFTGPGISGQLTQICQGADWDRDSDVDQIDFAIFQRCLSGDTVTADPDCAN
jgi:hypothetical protein